MPVGTKAAMESSNKKSSVDALLSNVNEFIQSIYNDVGLLSPEPPAASSSLRTGTGRSQRSEPWRGPTTVDTSTSELESSPNACQELNRRLPFSPQRRRNLDADIQRINRICDNVTLNLRSIGLDINSRDQAAASMDRGSNRPSNNMSPDNVAIFVDLSETQTETPLALRPVQTTISPILNQSNEVVDDDVVVVASNIPPVIDLCTPRYEEPLSRRSTVRRSRLSRRTLNHSPEGEEEAAAEVPIRRRRRLTNDVNNEVASVVVEATGSTDDIHNQSHNTSSESARSGDGGGGGAFICPICMDSCLRRRPTSTKCGHVFCEVCIKKAIVMTHKCPMCNKKILERQLIRLYP